MMDDAPLHEWPTLDEAALRDWAAQYVGWATNEMGDPADLSWRLDHDFRLEAFLAIPTDWEAYHRDEIIDGPRYDAEFADADYHTPIVVSIESGEIIIWDGWHRISCAIARGDRYIMAIVGRDSAADHPQHAARAIA